MKTKRTFIPGFPALGRPLVVAHRGASGKFPEHTPLAYQEALNQGADGFECDVRLTADEQLVCCHDSSVERTSNGVGTIETLSLKELETFDWGSWHGCTPAEGRRLLSLDEYIEIAKSCDRSIALFIETKHPSKFGAKVEASLLESLKRHAIAPGMGDSNVFPVLMSFSHLAVRRMRDAGTPTVMLMDKKYELSTDGWLANGATVAGPWVRMLRDKPKAVKKFHKRGHPVSVWTVNTPEDVRLCFELGVDAITTNYPDMAHRELTKLAARALDARKS